MEYTLTSPLKALDTGVHFLLCRAMLYSLSLSLSHTHTHTQTQNAKVSGVRDLYVSNITSHTRLSNLGSRDLKKTYAVIPVDRK